jgi:enolase
MMRIQTLHAREILDSRGRPTVEADVLLEDGTLGRAAVPSGASTGSAEAHELRDRDPERYEGFGVRKAIGHVNGEMAKALIGEDCRNQKAVDDRLRSLDGTPNLQRLGANAVLAVSLAVCRAAASAAGQMLHERIAGLAGIARPSLPLPMVNILSGGLHAGRGMDIQDFLAIPVGATSFADALHAVARVRSAASSIAAARGMPTLLADEGGISPGLATAEAALDMMMQCIEQAGLKPGLDIAIAIDVAATTFRGEHGGYFLRREGRQLTAEEWIDRMAQWSSRYPVVSIEDGLHEEDWNAWRQLTGRLSATMQLLGDDLFATNVERLKRGIAEGVANAVLVKLNQNGTLSGTLELIATARAAGYRTVVSARSGETEDSFMSDLAVGSNAGQIKIGSLRTSSTLSKYNQLLRIEDAGGVTYEGYAALRPPRGVTSVVRAPA